MEISITMIDGEHLSATVGNGIVLVTGMPGSGKDFVANVLLSKLGEVVLLDSLAEKSSGKWKVNLDKLSETVSDKLTFYVGISDNLREVKSALRNMYPNRPVFFMWISPSPKIFRRSNELKSRTDMESVPSSWKQIWKKRSELSDHAIIKLDEHELKFNARSLDVTAALVLRNEFHGDVAKITEGWHTWRTNELYQSAPQAVFVASSADFSTAYVIFDVSKRNYMLVRVHRDNSAFSVSYVSDFVIENFEKGESDVVLDLSATYGKLRQLVIGLAFKRLRAYLSLVTEMAPIRQMNNSELEEGDRHE